MTRESLEHMSIILEGIAFFLVTTDLYGEDRLLKLHEKIKSARPMDAGKKLLELVFTRKTVIMSVNGTLNILFFIAFLVYTNKFISSYPYWSYHYLIKWIVIIVGGVAMTYIVLFAIYLLFFFSYGAAFYILSLLIKILQIKPLKYIMLPLGTILFIISKIIAYINT